MLLARLGIIWANGNRIQIYGKEWGRLGHGAIAKLHANLLKGFKDGVYGPCETLAGLVGSVKAGEMATAHGVPKRVRMSHSQKRIRDDTSDGENQAGPSRRIFQT